MTFSELTLGQKGMLVKLKIVFMGLYNGFDKKLTYIKIQMKDSEQQCVFFNLKCFTKMQSVTG